MAEPLLVERDSAVMTLTLNMPAKRNPVSDAAMVDALCVALGKADRDIGVHAVILTGAGSAFSAGGDLKAMQVPDAGGLRAGLPAQTRRNYRYGIQRLPAMFHALEVPVIAAVNGAAIGAGCDLACMCDIRMAGRSATFASSFVTLGITPGDGGAWLLPRVVGFSKASELMLTGEIVDAEEACRIGLVSHVVDDGLLLEKARAVAEKIAANPAHATRMTKRLLRDGQDMTLANILEMSAAMQAIAHATADNQEAIDAFVERRKPVFRGK